MSWGEVKKINSDANVPLDERMGYVGGIVPRGNVAKIVSKSGRADSGAVEVLNIIGGGYIDYIYAYSTGVSHSVTVSLYIDEGTQNEKTIVLKSENNTTSITTDINKLHSPFDVNSSAVVEGDAVINSPIRFYNTLRVTYVSTNNSSNRMSLNYILI